MPDRFFAYPSQPSELSATIQSALQIIRDEFKIEGYVGWEDNDIAGRFIVDPIMEQIDGCELFAADVTRLNFNVTYEIGYAIGRRRRIFLTRNETLTGDDPLLRELGLFDTLGHKLYQNAKQLATMITSARDLKAISLLEDVNQKSPVYVVLPKFKTDLEIYLVSRIKKAKLHYRSFDPEELGRMSAAEAIKNVASSHGVIAPLIVSTRKDARVHNLRAAFVAGLATALDKELLLIQFGDDPVPLDYRDLVKVATSTGQLDTHIAEFAPAITARLQTGAAPVVAEPKTFLAKMNLGASAAENEMSELSEYYLETDEYRRARRGEVQVVAGRKGSGKTALFVRLRDTLRRDPQLIVLDLKPEGFQLLKFKDLVLTYLEQGTREHTITAFWEYLLLLEICHKILEKDRGRHISNHKLYEPYRTLAHEYKGDAYVAEGDFSERMLKLTQRIMEEFKKVIGPGTQSVRLSTEELTNLLYLHDTKTLRTRIAEYVEQKRGLWILFDNIDKGWPPRGLATEDLLILRCLLEAMGKLEKYLRKAGTDCRGIVFIRNDVYELLVESSIDRGKTTKVTLDWTDPDLLRELLRRRLVSNDETLSQTSFDLIWHQICVSHVGAEESGTYLIERCLMRPRSLIELIQLCRSHAVNLGHARIELEDIKEGESSYSNDVVINLGLEIRDVYPAAGDILYEFIGLPARLSEHEVIQVFKKAGIENEVEEQLLDLLLWFGFFGVVRDDGEVAYIYSVNYDMKHLKALVRRHTAGAIFFINPAFWAGLEIRP